MDLVTARRFARRSRSQVRTDDYFPCRGGLNLVDTPLEMQPGQLLGCLNYEPSIRGGYTRMAGYERFDGHTRPSDANYWLLAFDAGTLADYPDVGDTVTGDTSQATGVLLQAITETASGEATMVLGRVSGVFEEDENLKVGTTVFGVATGTAALRGATNDTDAEAFTALAIEDAREQIQVVPGSGSILGCVLLDGVVFAWRMNDDEDEVLCWYSTATGWTACQYNWEVTFDYGTQELLEGEVVTGVTSGATATIKHVIHSAGDWGTATPRASGELIFFGAVTNGPFEAGEDLTTPSGGLAHATEPEHRYVQDPGGSYEFRIHNFGGHAETTRIYGVDGVNFAFELDPVSHTISSIRTGMVTDAPTHLAVHKNALFLSFAGGSLQNSSVGDPLDWQVVLGASELGVGHEIQGLMEEVGDSLFIYSSRDTYVYQGDPASTFTLSIYAPGVSAFPGTIQRIGGGVFLDQRGFATLFTSDKYGNFEYTSISEKIEPLVNELRLKATASVTAKDKNLYRCFFSDSQFISLGFQGNQITGFTRCEYPIPVRCAFDEKSETGASMLVFGSDNGYIYQMDRGTSFDGAEIPYFMRLSFHHSRSPSRRKRYRYAQFDVEANGPTNLVIGVDYSFASAEEVGNPANAVFLDGGGGFWDVDNWDEFRWSTGVVANAKIKLEGSGINVGFLISGSSASELPHTVQGVTMHHSLRRINRST